MSHTGIGTGCSIFPAWWVHNRSTLVNGLVSYWTLNESSDGSAPITRSDSVGANHLTDNNTVSSTAGVAGNAATCVLGNLEYFSKASFPAWSTTAITVSMWVRVDVLPGANKAIFLLNPDFGTHGNPTTFETGTSVNKPRVFVGNGTGLFQATYATDIDTAWHMWTTWYDDAGDRKARIQIDNGAVVASTALTGTWANSGGVLGINRTPPNSYMTATYDEIGLWNRALTTVEIAELWAAGAGKFYPF